MRLSNLLPGQKAVIIKILGHGAFRKRVLEMGFVRGREVTMVLNAPLSDPIKFKLMDYEVSLRRSEADLIEVVPLEEWNSTPHSARHLTQKFEDENDAPRISKDKIINVALIGNPNCGKTTIFNRLAGAHEHVGNYAGVTVDAKAGNFTYKGYQINVVDLPGTYSLSAYSPEERYVLRYLKEEMPDVIVNVVVASNLERNLYLTTELIDMNRSLVIALNMYDELEKSNAVLDYELLGGLLGVPVVPTKGSSNWGIEHLLDTIIDVYELREPHMRHIHVKMRGEVEDEVNILKEEIKKNPDLAHHFSPRYLAIKMLEKDPEVERMLEHSSNYPELQVKRDEGVERIEKRLGNDVNSIVSAEKYGFIAGAMAEVYQSGREEKTTSIIDAFVTNKLFGFPIFILVMWLMFWTTFKIGSYPMEWIEDLISWSSLRVESLMPDGPLKDLILDGIIGGVGGVIVFLPNILILYAFISFLEGSGYMARVAFIMDKLMHRMGLHGKSFIPLIMGFGCNVPAILSSRIIESKSSRIITVLINPFISCSARIPIYVLLVGAFFPHYGAWVFVGLYLLGIIVAVVTARLLRKFWFKTDETPFVMELPPYRLPGWRSTVKDMWFKARQYLQKMGGIILVASIIIWALSYFPRKSSVPEEEKAQLLTEMSQASLEGKSAEEIDDLLLTEYRQESSILGHIGKFVEPVMRPMEFSWKTCVSLFAGASAKEVVVSTLGVLYVGYDDADVLSQRLSTPSPVTGNAPFTVASALAFMVFVLLYFPCIASLTAIARETGSWRYSLFSVVYNTGIAWICSYIVFLLASL